LNHLEELKKTGYTKIEQAFGDSTIAQLLDRVRGLAANNHDVKGLPFLDRGGNVVYNLCLKDSIFLREILNQSEVCGILMAMLNDQWFRPIPADKPNFILKSLNARAGGKDPMPVHIDSLIPSSGQFTWSMQISIILEEHTVDNGTTLIVPGSHLYDRYATQEDRANAIPSLAKPGDVVFWDSRLWHATLPNKTTDTRWAIIATFVRWWVKQAFDFTGSLSKELLDQYTDAELAVLGYCSMPPEDETHRVDMKVGYEALRERRASK